MSSPYLTRITYNNDVGILNNVFTENYIVKFTGQGNVIVTGFDTVNKNSFMIINNTNNILLVKHNSTLSEESNRIWFENEIDFNIPDGGMASFKYLSDLNKFIIVSSAGTGNDGAEIDPVFSNSSAKNITPTDLQRLKSLEFNGGMFTVWSDGFTDTYNIEHGLSGQPRTVSLTRCNQNSYWSTVVVNDQVITFVSQDVPPQDVPISVYWLAFM